MQSGAISSSIANLADRTARKPKSLSPTFQSPVGRHLDQQRIGAGQAFVPPTLRLQLGYLV